MCLYLLVRDHKEQRDKRFPRQSFGDLFAVGGSRFFRSDNHPLSLLSWLIDSPINKFEAADEEITCLL
jgi:hypothetical protein